MVKILTQIVDDKLEDRFIGETLIYSVSGFGFCALQRSLAVEADVVVVSESVVVDIVILLAPETGNHSYKGPLTRLLISLKRPLTSVCNLKST